MKTRLISVTLGLASCVAMLTTTAANLRAATLAVTTTADNGVGSLRAALKGSRNGDTIQFSLPTPSIITLTSGELLVSKSVNILGPGDDSLAVSGNFANRVFHISSGTTVTIAGLTVMNGRPASRMSPSAGAAGIWNDHATLTVSNCTVSGNVASGNGGGIYNDGSGNPNGMQKTGGATLMVVNSTLSGNSAAGIGGGGIYNDAGYGAATMTVVNSTFSGNSATPFGGGICNYYAGTLMVVNSTFSGNSASGTVVSRGGAIYTGGSSTVTGCTLIGNSATGPDGSGGGIYDFYGVLTLTSSILSDNLASGHFGQNGNGVFVDRGTLNYGFSLFSNPVFDIYNSGGTVTPVGRNLFGVNPMLGPLQDNGGPTWTHAPLPGSPAIDQGKNFSGLAIDQRGFARSIDFLDIANAPNADGTDIGAVEVQ